MVTAPYRKCPSGSVWLLHRKFLCAAPEVPVFRTGSGSGAMKLLTHNLLSSHVPGLRPGGGFPLRIEVRGRGGTPGLRELPGIGEGGALRFPFLPRDGPAAFPLPLSPVPLTPVPVAAPS